VLLVLPLVGTGARADRTIVVGSKKFTESVILGEIAAQSARSMGYGAEHEAELGGTRILFNALVDGALDVYPDYTGTITHEILKDLELSGEDDIRAALAERGIRMTDPLGFNNTYAMGMKPEVADRLEIRAISDLRRHPELRFGLTSEFMDRGDGWPALKGRYHLPQRARGLDHDLAYRALESGDIDVMDLYSTDAEIAYYGLRVLEDDLVHFPRYDAVFLYRAELARDAPEVLETLLQLAKTIDDDRMRRMNARVKIEGASEASVAAAFLAERFQLETEFVEEAMLERLWHRTVEHLFLVSISLALAIVLSVPLGILAFRRPRAGQVILGAVGTVQTIPALALLVFMMPLLGIYAPPAIAALFLYSLLPIVRNTHAGLADIPGSILESAEALGLSPAARLWWVELPLASRSILAGIKTSAVINVGFATLGALIGAGGYGQPIFTGIRLDDYGLILEGAIPAVLLALLAQLLFELAERAVVPKGLRLRPAA
jgi:osmoprotectant transport system permease protein